MSTLLSELAKAKAVFQQRAIKAILEQRPIGNEAGRIEYQTKGEDQ